MGTLLFIFIALFSIYSAIAVIIFTFLHRPKDVKATILRFIGVLGVFFTMLLLVSLLSKGKTLPINKDKCFDEWCAAVTSFEKMPNKQGSTLYFVKLKISNKGRGRPQKPDNPNIYVVDEKGAHYNESFSDQKAYEAKFGQQQSYSKLIDPQSSFETVMSFRIPTNRKANLVITEGGWPTYFIMGDEGSLLHKKSITPLL